MTEREDRTDLCVDCKDEDHVECSLDSSCSCCLITLAMMAEELGGEA